jgi:putative addiction module CopG family antidote
MLERLEDEPMEVPLDPELARFVEEQVQAGRFGSREEVVSTALAGFRTSRS